MGETFLLFMNPEFYPCGGMGDCVGKFSTLQAALDHATKRGEDDYVEVLEIGDTLIVHDCRYNVLEKAYVVVGAEPLSEYMTARKVSWEAVREDNDD